jgi:molybdopterin molybdotransferase
MISRIKAQNLVDNSISVLGIEEKPIQECLGYVLAKDISSKLDSPPFDKSAMDGYAVCLNEASAELTVIDVVQAGQIPTIKVQEGTAVKIMTGAPIPKGAGKVVMKEDVEAVSEEKIIVNQYHKNSNICIKGEDIKSGHVIYKDGQQITAVVAANIVSSGISKVMVYKKPSVGIIVTGSELLEVGASYEDGKIYNSNGTLLKSVLEINGIEEIEVFVVKDEEDKLTSTIRSAIEEKDLVLITGGISVGDYDYTKSALISIGAETVFHKVSVKPGKPVGFFNYKNKPIYALPGNPVSVFLSYYIYVLPTIRKMQGLSPERKFRRMALKNVYERKKDDREQFVPVEIDLNGNIEMCEYNGSAHIYALSNCNGFLVLPKGKKKIEAGESAEILLI